MSTSYSAGPWIVHPYLTSHGEYNRARDVGPCGLTVAVVLGEFENPEMGAEGEANARLIAAAPDLLQALEMAVMDHESSGQWIDEARAAIAKAGGRS